MMLAKTIMPGLHENVYKIEFVDLWYKLAEYIMGEKVNRKVIMLDSDTYSRVTILNKNLIDTIVDNCVHMGFQVISYDTDIMFIKTDNIDECIERIKAMLNERYGDIQVVVREKYKQIYFHNRLLKYYIGICDDEFVEIRGYRNVDNAIKDFIENGGDAKYFVWR